MLRDGRPVALAPKDFEVLAALVRRSGSLVGKEELLKEVWPDSFVEEANLSRHVYALRRALGEDEEGLPYIETVPKRGYRFTANVRSMATRDGNNGVVAETGGNVQTVTRTHIVAEEEISVVEEDPPRALREAKLALPGPSTARDVRVSRAVIFGTLAALALVVTFASYFYFRRSPALTDKDVILVADFQNSTGDDVFDGTLKQALAVQLEQSPFLSVLSEERVREALQYMGRAGDVRVTREVAREICERQGLKAMLVGSVAQLGTRYVITIEAINAATGDTIAREQAEVGDKDQVLRTLGAAATTLRGKLGESLASVQKFDAPIEQATTSSLEAFKAFSLGNELAGRGKYREAIPFYRRAVELDPSFALAYAKLANMHDNVREPKPTVEFARKAFDLRERVSQREQLYISASYYDNVTGELDKEIEILQLLKQTYPRDSVPHSRLSSSHLGMGQYEKAEEAAREALRLNPNFAAARYNLGTALLGLNRFDDAREIYEQAVVQKTDTAMVHVRLYQIAFIKGDAAGMERQLNWWAGGLDEYNSLRWQADAAGFVGRHRKARELYERSAELALGRGLKEIAAEIALIGVSRNALVGDCRQVGSDVTSALEMARNRNTLGLAVYALAFCGLTDQAQSLMGEYEKGNPTDPMQELVALPSHQAALALGGNPKRAVQLMQKSIPYDLTLTFTLWPIYIRGLAHLRAGDAAEATVVFQKILDHRGVAGLSLRYPLSYLGLGRSLALAGDTVKARKAYEDFFALWSDADPDIPILLEAKREYASLR